MIRDRVMYVPAGLEAWPGRTGQVFVKLEKNAKQSIKKGPGYKELRLRDRTLFIVYESGKQHRLIDKQLDCDYMVAYQNPVELRNRVELVLVNPVHADRNFRNVFKAHNIKIISDSGGFQMLRGVSEFIHPDVPTAFYNKHMTNIGMPLDLPMRTAYEPLFFDAATKMMKANDAYMIPRLDPGVTLALVSHGSNIEMRKRRLDAIYRPTPVIAIAGLNTLTDEATSRHLTALVNAMYVISQTREDTEYYHFLGVTSRFWFIIYAVMVGIGYVKSCGGDSVSHRMGAITGLYKHQLAYSGGRHLQIEKLSRKSVNTSCTCFMCHAVGDLNILADFQLCESHNIWYSEQEKDLICDSVQSYLDGHLSIRQLADQWLSKGQYTLLYTAIEYIEAVAAKGFFPLSAKRGESLFEGLDEPKLDPEVKQRYVTILRNYEKFHKKKFL